MSNHESYQVVGRLGSVKISYSFASIFKPSQVYSSALLGWCSCMKVFSLMTFSCLLTTSACLAGSPLTSSKYSQCMASCISGFSTSANFYSSSSCFLVGDMWTGEPSLFLSLILNLTYRSPFYFRFAISYFLLWKCSWIFWKSGTFNLTVGPKVSNTYQIQCSSSAFCSSKDLNFI